MSGGRLYVGAFSRNMASTAVKTFSHLIYLKTNFINVLSVIIIIIIITVGVFLKIE